MLTASSLKDQDRYNSIKKNLEQTKNEIIKKNIDPKTIAAELLNSSSIMDCFVGAYKNKSQSQRSFS